MSDGVKVWSTEGEDNREHARVHINMVFGETWVLVVDRQYRPALRSMKVEVDEVISESNYERIFTEVMTALSESGNISNDETAACITFPAGTVIHQTEIAKA